MNLYQQVRARATKDVDAAIDVAAAAIVRVEDETGMDGEDLVRCVVLARKRTIRERLIRARTEAIGSEMIAGMSGDDEA